MGLDADVAADVAIVGGGIGGLATAWHLADRGITSVVLEAAGVATGASGRNGGFFIAGAAPMYNDARARFGSGLARRIYAATCDAQREILAVAAELGAAEHFRRVGMLRLAVDPVEADHVREHHRALASDGFAGDLVAEEDLPAPLRRPGRIGLWTDHDGAVHPVRWLTRLADGLRGRGVRIVEGTRVSGPIGRGGLAVGVGDHTVHAAAVVVAADGQLGSLVPAMAERVAARRLHMVATVPLATDHVRHPVYARYGYEYHQQLPDGRVVLGGFSDLDGRDSYTDRDEANPVVHERLARYLTDELAVAAPISHRWVGTVGYTHDQRPYAGPAPHMPGVYVLGGYCGTGNIVAWVGARIVVDLIASGASPDVDLFDPSRFRHGGGAVDADDQD